MSLTWWLAAVFVPLIAITGTPKRHYAGIWASHHGAGSSGENTAGRNAGEGRSARPGTLRAAKHRKVRGAHAAAAIGTRLVISSRARRIPASATAGLIFCPST